MGLSLAALCAERAVSAREVAVACGVSDSIAYRWWRGEERAAEKHAEALGKIIGEAQVEAYFAAWPVLTRGRPPSDTRFMADLRRVAKRLLAKGHAELAAELTKLADASDAEGGGS